MNPDPKPPRPPKPGRPKKGKPPAPTPPPLPPWPAPKPAPKPSTNPVPKPRPQKPKGTVGMDEGSIQGAMSGLARVFPDMMPPTIGMSGYPSNITLPSGAYRTTYMLPIPNFTPSTEPGIHMGMAFITPRLVNHTLVVNSWTGDSVTGPSSTTTTAANSPNYTQLASLSTMHVYTGICVRVLNASSMMNSSGTFLMSSIQQSAIGSSTPSAGVWTNLNAAPGVEKLVFPKDANRCVAYQASGKADFDPQTVSTSGFDAGFGCLVFMYRSTVAQAIQLEITEIGTHVPLSSSAGLIPTTRVLSNPVVYEQVINSATSANTMNQQAAKPAERKSLFDKVANTLGPHVRNAIGKLPGGGLVNGAYDFLSNLFGGSKHLPHVLRTLSQGHSLRRELEDPNVIALLPPELFQALQILARTEIVQAEDHAYVRYNGPGADKVYKLGFESDNSDPFGAHVAAPYCRMHSHHEPAQEEETKSDASFVALRKNRK